MVTKSDKKPGKLILIIASLLMMVTNILINVAASIVIGSIGTSDYRVFIRNVLLAVAIVIFCLCIRLAFQFIKINYIRNYMINFRVQVVNTILDMSYCRFNSTSKDSYISNLTNDVNTIENNYFDNFMRLISASGTFIFSIAFIFILDYKYALAILSVVVVFTVICRLSGEKAVSLETDVSRENEKFTTDIGNTFNGLPLIKLNRVEKKFSDRILITAKFLENKKSRRDLYNSIYDKILSYIVIFLYIFVLYYLFNGFMAGGSFMKIAFIAFFTDQSFSIANAFTLYNKHKSYIAVMDKLLKEGKYNESSNEDGDKEFHFTSSILLKDVTYSYGDKIILNKANLTLERGKKYLIRGKSGEGKSTLMKILSKIIEDYEGEILMDGIDYRRINLASFNRNISFITQDTFLFEDTLRNNITLYNEYTAEQIRRAVELSGVDTIFQGKSNIDSVKLNENGGNLSGGERQRIAIARSIIRNTDIVFVDECTSSLDKEMALKIEDTLLNLDATVIEISHRAYEEVINKYDYIIDLNKGQLSMWSPQQSYMEVSQ